MQTTHLQIRSLGETIEIIDVRSCKKFRAIDKPENFVQREVRKKVTPTSIVPRRWQAGMSLNAILTSMLVAWISRPR